MWRFYRISEREATIAKLHRFIELAAFDLRCQILQYICKTFVRGGQEGLSPPRNFGGIRIKKRSRNMDNLLLLNLIFSKKATKMWWNSPSFLLASKQNWEISSNFCGLHKNMSFSPPKSKYLRRLWYVPSGVLYSIMKPLQQQQPPLCTVLYFVHSLSAISYKGSSINYVVSVGGKEG